MEPVAATVSIGLLTVCVACLIAILRAKWRMGKDVALLAQDNALLQKDVGNLKKEFKANKDKEGEWVKKINELVLAQALCQSTCPHFQELRRKGGSTIKGVT